MDGEVREVASQGLGLPRKECAGNIDRHIGADPVVGEKQPRFRRCTGAEFDQRCVFRNRRGDFAAAFPQNAKLGARRIVLRQPRDLLEQVGAGFIIKIFRRELLGLLIQSQNSIPREHRIDVGGFTALGSRGYMNTHASLRCIF